MKKINLKIFLLISILLILFSNLNFFKKTFFLLTKSFDQRFINAYIKDYFSGYCLRESHGYVQYLKNRYKIDISPKIINLEKRRNKLPYWIFNKIYSEIDENKLILLNYDKSINFNFGNYVVIDNYENKCFYLEKK